MTDPKIPADDPEPDEPETPVEDEGTEATEDVEAEAELAPEPAPTPQQIGAWKARAEEAAVLEDRLKRAQAEFVNESRRIQRQAEESRRYALEGIVRELSAVVESLDQALKAAGDARPDPLRAGIALVLQKTEDLLKRHGAEVLRPLGQPFDPGAHEALMMVERDDLAPGLVAEVVSPGMRLNGRVVKPAQVAVARAPAAPAPAKD